MYGRLGKLAILFYNTLAFGKEYLEQGELKYQQKQEDWERRKLANLAQKYKCTLVAQMVKQ